LAQRHAFPQALAERHCYVQALHRLQEALAVLLAEVLQLGEVDGVVLLQRARRLHLRGAVADDLQPPRLRREPGLHEGIALERMWPRIAPADIAKLGGVSEVGTGVGHDWNPRAHNLLRL